MIWTNHENKESLQKDEMSLTDHFTEYRRIPMAVIDEWNVFNFS